MTPLSTTGRYGLIAGIVLLTAAIFAVDLWLPRGTSEWALYLLPILFTMWLPSRTFSLWLTAVITVLAVVGYVLSPEGVPTWISLTNRTFGILVMWTATGLVIVRRSAEAALSRSEQQFRELAENIQDVFWLTSPDMQQVHYVSPAYERIWGKPCASLQDHPQSWLASVHRQDRAAIEQFVRDRVPRETGRETYRILHPDGTLRWIYHRTFPIHDPQGRVCRVAGLAKDVTERHTAERRRAAQYAVTRILAESDDLPQMTAKVLQVLCENLEWEMSAFWRVDQVNNRLHYETFWCVPEFNPIAFDHRCRDLTLSRGIGLPGRVWASGEATWIPDLRSDANFPRMAMAGREGLESALAFPVRWDNQTLGVFEFFSRASRQPDDDLLHMLGAVGSQIGQFTMRKRAEEDRAHLLGQLQDSLARVKTLKGLLPLCSSCQKVKDQGAWKELTSYVRSHSEAEFRPDLCPTCGEGLFPDFYRTYSPRMH